MANHTTQWTHDDDVAAGIEGWGVFDAADGLEIERDDEAAIFACDADAIAFVNSRAKTGSDLHMRGLAITSERKN